MSYEELLDKDDFTVWIPNVASFSKADSTGQRRIGGYASTGDKDRQNEILVQKGLDFSEFVDHGYFNDNHKQDTDAVVGIPELAKHIPNKGWYVEGYLLPNWPLADRIWGLAKALEDTKRRLGFSVEGKVLQRGEGNKILRALIRNVAITNRPVNTACSFSTLSKAFGTDEEISECYDATTGKSCSCSVPNAVKAMSAGSSNPIVAGGGVMRTEDLEHDEESTSINDPRLNIRRKNLELDKAVEFLRRIRPQYSENLCRRIYAYSSRLKEAR